MLKRIENIDGETGRDYEIGYKIESKKTSSHFGRSVQPERLEKTFGEITDEDIANNDHPLVEDNFFCSQCEDRLAQIESEYAKTIDTKDENEYESGVNFPIGLLFWGSILWRMSVHGESGVKLTSKQNEFLREILDSFLPRKNGIIDEKLISESDSVKSISYKLLRCHNCDRDDSKWLIIHPDFYNSPCLFIDEFILVYSLNGKYVEYEETDCFEMNDLILEAPINIVGYNEVIKPFDKKRFKELGVKIANKAKDEYVRGCYEIFDQVHIAIGGKGEKMPINIKQEIMKEIIFNESKIGRKYSQEEIKNSIFKVLKKYAP
jgi:hypothetical protein